MSALVDIHGAADFRAALAAYRAYRAALRAAGAPRADHLDAWHALIERTAVVLAARDEVRVGRWLEVALRRAGRVAREGSRAP